MPTFALVYHLAGSDHKPQETIEAESIQAAGDAAAKRFESAGAIAVPSGEDLVVMPKASIAYCHLRQIQERRRAPIRNYDDEEEEAAPEGAAAG